MRSIRHKLTLLTAVSILVATLSITITACLNIRSHAYQEAEREINQVAQLQGGFVSEWLSVRKNLISASLSHADDAQVSYYLQQLAKGGGFNVIYAGNGATGDMKYSVPGRPKPSADYQPAQRPWFQQSKAQDGLIVTDPYKDSEPETKDKLVITIADKVKGQDIVVGGDILIDKLVKSVLDIKLAGKGHAFLLTKQGKIIAYPKPGNELKPIGSVIPALDDAAFASLLQSDQAKSVDIDGGAYMVALRPIAGSDWVMGVAADEEVISSQVNGIIWLIAGAVAIVLAVMLTFSSAYLGRLLKGLFQVRDAMREISQGEGDLTRRIEVAGEDEVAQTAQAFNQFVQRLNGMFRELRDEAGQLTQGVIEVSGAVKRLADDSHVLADISSSNAAAIEEVTVSISHIADATRETDSLARNTGEHSRESANDMQRISSEMSRTSESVGELSSLLASLEQRSQEISKITNVIRDIADQTNLLALNAAIEAARAGEQGRGFAVVADEVRKLAERTGQATVEISQMVENILGETGKAVQNMNTTVGAVDASVDLTGQARARLTAIGDAMQQVIDKIGDVALSTSEQHNATTAMAQSTESINNQIIDSDAALQSAMQTLSALNDLARGMQSTFNRFRL
ncbi:MULTISPECIES: methyl-accepting chemotaxis protein [Chromobacterium]|uniref:Methyl-accepting chemotaxis protein n=2 Tax=Chromobacterium TaxID=535 RepID=A0ABS3GQV6_9NEIS|nr:MULTISPECIES: methyl-accepting chemotaxis protein [Chromobacterium]AXT45375.1 methyl-accepting chemotaxis protein [Chromobacterium rhizoryzae]MBK0416885.1 methyl-accepting chemotaxis protein [Chromobacterium haemolyticum]MBO0416990.1 methyl-accepting chemotaxis protein [Chromobacterium haemolyticum]MBO0501273.1 methyl-accepting chemotaxis protein [Chromobacterium haemolyticum]MDH0341648.1 methyl-accepting chemotaxis protein [Chromobacterium haemolyticum]